MGHLRQKSLVWLRFVYQDISVKLFLVIGKPWRIFVTISSFIAVV